jgi:aryl-alcohol dehydrogenase-like predicted oxidoreductase
MSRSPLLAPRALGSAGPRVLPPGLGYMGMSGMDGPADEGESLATIHAALDRGVTLLDTGDFYGAGHDELRAGDGAAACTSADRAGAPRPSNARLLPLLPAGR